MIYSGKVTTTPGTPVALGGQVRATWVFIQWPTGASGNLYVGGPTTTKPFSSNTPVIVPGGTITLPNISTSPLPYSLDKILVDSDNANTVVFLYGKG